MSYGSNEESDSLNYDDFEWEVVRRLSATTKETVADVEGAMKLAFGSSRMLWLKSQQRTSGNA